MVNVWFLCQRRFAILEIFKGGEFWFPRCLENGVLTHGNLATQHCVEYQLKRKREEYWDTAPAFEGKAEIWAALKETFLHIYCIC